MLWAACCLCFFGFLRSGEAVAPTVKDYDPRCHLSFDDVCVDNRANPSFLRVRILKTDPFRQGVDIYVGHTENELCPVKAVLAYMASSNSKQGPLFQWEDGRYLAKEAFVAAMRQALAEVGLDSISYAGHSFRIGAATTAARQGLQDSLIKTLGRWESSAYTAYIRTPPSTLCKVARTLAARAQ